MRDTKLPELLPRPWMHSAEAIPELQRRCEDLEILTRNIAEKMKALGMRIHKLENKGRDE